jgi:hypothetical protein
VAALFSFTAQACGAVTRRKSRATSPSRSHPRPRRHRRRLPRVDRAAFPQRACATPPSHNRPIIPANSHNCVAAAAPPSKSRHRCRIPFGHSSTVRSCAFPQCNNVTIWLQVHACWRPAGGVTLHIQALHARAFTSSRFASQMSVWHDRKELNASCEEDTNGARYAAVVLACHDGAARTRMMSAASLAAVRTPRSMDSFNRSFIRHNIICRRHRRCHQQLFVQRQRS